MPTTQTPPLRVEDATRPHWFGSLPRSWGNVVRSMPFQPRTAAEAIAGAGLGWAVEQHPIEAVIGEGEEIHRIPVPRVVANVRADTWRVLGIVGEGYEPLQNAAAFSFCDALTGAGASWVGAGSTRGGARVHALMRLDREIRIGDAEGEDLLPLLCLRNGHDGGLAVTISVAPFRLACLNGMLLPIEGAARTWKARHTQSLDARLVDARRSLGVAHRYYDQLEELGGVLLRRRLDALAFDRFLSQLVPLPVEEDETRGGRAVRNALRVRDAIKAAQRDAPDLANIRGTAWGALQAVAAHHDHYAPVRESAGRTSAEARFERATQPARLKDRALALLLETTA